MVSFDSCLERGSGNEVIGSLCRGEGIFLA